MEQWPSVFKLKLVHSTLFGSTCAAHYIKNHQSFLFFCRSETIERFEEENHIALYQKPIVIALWAKSKKKLPQSTRLFRNAPIVLLICRKDFSILAHEQQERHLSRHGNLLRSESKIPRASIHVLLVEDGYTIYYRLQFCKA
jgi:hypothetical protein